ncbi:uncharacterized protein [Zea mays]|uniref:uncharacterized protein n=1 Tax=Zea mays TaxID=4577 RepID=UPI0002209202|nr:uncharacterized protein LOC111589577 [Zea mays]|eukprot:XP_023156212.1 uncharacterized protein LOC111589577 [Zea mays]
MEPTGRARSGAPSPAPCSAPMVSMSTCHVMERMQHNWLVPRSRIRKHLGALMPTMVIQDISVDTLTNHGSLTMLPFTDESVVWYRLHHLSSLNLIVYLQFYTLEYCVSAPNYSD